MKKYKKNTGSHHSTTWQGVLSIAITGTGKYRNTEIQKHRNAEILCPVLLLPPPPQLPTQYQPLALSHQVDQDPQPRHTHSSPPLWSAWRAPSQGSRWISRSPGPAAFSHHGRSGLVPVHPSYLTCNYWPLWAQVWIDRWSPLVEECAVSIGHCKYSLVRIHWRNPIRIPRPAYVSHGVQYIWNNNRKINKSENHQIMCLWCVFETFTAKIRLDARRKDDRSESGKKGRDDWFRNRVLALETGYLHQICYLSNDSPCENGRRTTGELIVSQHFTTLQCLDRRGGPLNNSLRISVPIHPIP